MRGCGGRARRGCIDAELALDVVDQLDLAPFYQAHRADGHGHPAYDPKTLLGVLLYAYCLGVRSSRQIERRLTEDVALRVLAANQTPDHVTIARFRARHQTALAGFLVTSLRLCAAAGMVRVGVVALDGTKLAGSAADKANRTLDKLDAEVAACDAEWKLLCGTHNLLKLWRHTCRQPAATPITT